MRRVELVDTSILVEILDVPGRNSNRVAVMADLRSRRADSSLILLLPTATVIETGNHVHHIADGHARRRCADSFAGVLAATITGQAPWMLLNAEWDGVLLEAIRSGAATGMDLVEHAVQQCLSCGDLSVLAERAAYRSRVSSAVKIGIWSLDEAMNAWS